MEIEEFLYMANKNIIVNKASNDSAHIKAFIKEDISETDLNVIKEEIKYLMFCLLNFYTFGEISVKNKILNLNDEKAITDFKFMSYFSLERAFLTTMHDFDYSVEIYKNRYAKYTQYLGIYNYKDFERSFLECFAMQVTGGFEDSVTPLNLDFTQLLQLARWVYRAHGEVIKESLDELNFKM